MAPSKLAILSIFLALIFSQIRADNPARLPVRGPGASPSDGPHQKIKPPRDGRHLSVGGLFAKKGQKKNGQRNGVSPEEREKVIQGLTEEGDQIIQELREEGGKVIQEMLDSIIQEMSGSISSLPTEIKFLQKNGSLVEQQVRKAHARADELEKKVNELEQKLQSQRKEKEELESRTNEAEEKIDDLLSEIENIGKTNDEQETKIRKTEHALEVKVAEVEMWKAKFEATLKAKVLNEVNELEKELQSQRNEKGDLKDRVNEAEKKIDDLLSKIENVNELEKELQSQRNEKGDLKDRANEAEKKMDDLLSKLENVNELEKELQSQRNEKRDLKDRVNEAEKKMDDLLSKIENVNELEKELQSQHNEKRDLKDRVNEAKKKIDDLLSKIENVNELEKELQMQRNEKGDLKDQVNEVEKMDDLLSKIENVNELEKELQLQRNEKRDLKDRVNEAEKKIDDLFSKIENVNELEKELQSQRNEKGDLKDRVNEAEKKMDDLLSKIENALEKKAQAEKWAEPHVETTKTKSIPAIKEQWVVVKDTVELHVISLSNKSIEVYEVSKTTLAPHVIKAQEVVDIYFQEAKKFSKPYVDQLTTVTKPHVDKAVIAYEKFLKPASTYHHQVQGTVKDLLKRHELTRPLATKELEWFAASALLALPIIILFRIFSSLFCTKTKNPVRGTNHTRRKAKRGHPEK
ncbi:uncharacterized protein [Malus domestica]|uniref:uncharacterized protein isoform X4 n=1 Tax=Malus domestica TaxID=3750 RepID=UPI003976041B